MRVEGADLCAAALALLGAGLRLAAAPAAPGTFDEVGFTAALTRYDLLAFEPHFPGYPLAVLLARAAAGVGAAAPYAAAAAALTLLGALALHVAAGRGWGGALTGGLLAIAPLAVMVGSRATSDGVALGLLALAAAALVASRRADRGAPRSGLSALAGVLAAATAAAKPDLGLFLPAVALASSPRAALAAAAPVLLLAAASLVPAAGGVGALMAEATRFTGGHLGDWGGGVLASAGATPARPLLAVAPLCEALGARGPLGHLLAGLALLALTLRAPRWARRGAVVACVPYALWLLLGQNLANPRHALPLLVPAGLLAGQGLARAALRPGLRVGLALALLSGAGLGAARAVLEERARGRAVDALEAALDGDGAGVRLYAGGEARALAWRRPGADVHRARSVRHALDQLALDPCPPARVWVASTVAGACELPCVYDLDEVQVFALDPGRWRP